MSAVRSETRIRRLIDILIERWMQYPFGNIWKMWGEKQRDYRVKQWVVDGVGLFPEAPAMLARAYELARDYDKSLISELTNEVATLKRRIGGSAKSRAKKVTKRAIWKAARK